jgi:hypothetical protein
VPKFSDEELSSIAKVPATEKPIAMPSLAGEPPDFSRRAMAEAAAISEAVTGTSNPLGKEDGPEPSLSRQRNNGNMAKAPKGQVEPDEPAPGDDEPEDWESFFNGGGGPSAASKRKVKNDVKESIMLEAEQALEEGTLEEYLSDIGDTLVEAITDNQVLAEALGDSRTENERLACKAAFADFTRSCSNFHREKMAQFLHDFDTWHMARNYDYLQKVSDQVKEAGNRLKKGVNGQDPFWADCDKAPDGAAQASLRRESVDVAQHDIVPTSSREMDAYVRATRDGPLGTRQS